MTQGQPGRSLILGLGNDLLGDDGVGFVIARQAASQVPPTCDVVESGEAGLALLELLADYEQAVILDSIQTGAEPGTIHKLRRDDFAKIVAPSAHYAGLPEVFDLGERIGVKLPSRLLVIAVEVEDPFSFSETLTPKVENAVPAAVENALEFLGFTRAALV